MNWDPGQPDHFAQGSVSKLAKITASQVDDTARTALDITWKPANTTKSIVHDVFGCPAPERYNQQNDQYISSIRYGCSNWFMCSFGTVHGMCKVNLQVGQFKIMERLRLFDQTILCSSCRPTQNLIRLAIVHVPSYAYGYIKSRYSPNP